MIKKAIVLLSGGLDSATTAAIAISEEYEVSALTFRYGQKHDVELTFAKKLVDFFKIKNHVIIDIPADIFNSALVSGTETEVPKNRKIDPEHNIPVTYVPARNILFLSYALAYAESWGSRDIFIGANAVDYSGYPDCRPEFFDSFNEMATLGTKSGVEGKKIIVRTPIIKFPKFKIIKKGIDLGVDYSLTHSCYDPFEDGTSCGECDSCCIRKEGFMKAGVPDPTKYRLKK